LSVALNLKGLYLGALAVVAKVPPGWLAGSLPGSRRAAALQLGNCRLQSKRNEWCGLHNADIGHGGKGIELKTKKKPQGSTSWGKHPFNCLLSLLN